MKKIILTALCASIALYAADPVYQIDFEMGLDQQWRTLKAEGGFMPKVVRIGKQHRLRLTNRRHDLSSAVTLDYRFPSHDNKVVLEFDYYAYGGCRDGKNYRVRSTGAGSYGADGMSIILFDSDAGATPAVGASGGSLGYANGNIEMKNGRYKKQRGFERGWLGIGLDEFGAFSSNTEDRHNISGRTLSPYYIEGTESPNSIVIRGDAAHGYRLYYVGTEGKPIAEQLDDEGTQRYGGGHYRLTIDSSDPAHLYITMERDGRVVIDRYDAAAYQHQKPEYFRIAFSSGTGGGCNNHEIDNVKIYGKGEPYNPDASKPFTCSSESFVSFNRARWAGDGDAQFDTISLLDGTLKSHHVLPEVEGVNTMGYNVKDNYLWGYNIGSDKLVRIDANHHAKRYDLPEGFPADFYIAGDVDPNGILHLAARGKHEIQRVNVDPGSPDFLKALPPLKLRKPNGSRATIATADFAFNPRDGKLYFIQEGTGGKIYRIDPKTGVMEYVVDSGVDPYVVICFFDRDGNFYFNLGTGKDTRALYRIDMNDPRPAVKFSDLDKGLRNGDGARCPNAAVDATPHLSVTAVQKVIEGDSGTKEVTFAISSDHPIESKAGIVIHYKTRAGSAEAGSDFVSQSGTVTLTGSAQRLTLPLVIGDKKIERDEDFYLDLTADGVTFTNSSAQVVIVDDDQATFDAFDAGSGGVGGSKKVTTKVVGTPFVLELAQIEDATHYAEGADTVTDTRAKIVPSSACSDDPAALDSSGFVPFSLGGAAHVDQSFTVDHAIGEAKVQFVWRDARGDTHAACSSDPFAIRPDHYQIALPSHLVAGKDFNITVTARDAAGNPVTDYQADAGDYRIDINETKAAQGCALSALQTGKHPFVNGVAKVQIHYPDVGKLQFAVSEKVGNEFAHIDAQDGSGMHRFITPATTTGNEIVPAAIDLEWHAINGDSANGCTYFNSYDPADPDRAGMKAVLDMKIKVRSADGTLTGNFTDGCYARDVAIDMIYDINSSDSDPLYRTHAAYQDINGTFRTDVSGLPDAMQRGNHYVAMQMEKGLFRQGIGVKKINFNFERAVNKPREPMHMTIEGMKATLGNLQKIDATPQRLSFLYARAHIPDQQIVGDEGAAKVFYEVWSDRGDRTRFGLDHLPESVDDVHWYQLARLSETTWLDFEDPAVTNHLTAAPGTISAATGLFASMQKSSDHRALKMKVRKTPTRAKVDYKPAPYLIFDPADAAATQGSFIADFVPDDAKWGGRGKTGFTVDTKINPRTHTDKLDW